MLAVISILLQVIRYSAPVAFGAIGESVVQKSGVINIGLEGTMLAASYGATVLSIATGNAWLGLIGGICVGILFTLLIAVFTVTLRQDQIVVGTAMNLLATGVCGTLFERMGGSTGKLLNLPAIPFFEPFGKGNGRIDLILILLIVSAVVVAYAIKKTNWGLKLRAAGEYPDAVAAAGFSSAVLRYQALAIGGLLGGLAGAYYALGIANSFATEMISGRGFIAIAMVTFARWKPGWILAASIMLGGFEWLQYQLQVNGSLIPKPLLLALPYIATLVVLILVGKGAQAPKSLGVPLKESGDSV